MFLGSRFLKELQKFIFKAEILGTGAVAEDSVESPVTVKPWHSLGLIYIFTCPFFVSCG